MLVLEKRQEKPGLKSFFTLGFSMTLAVKSTMYNKSGLAGALFWLFFLMKTTAIMAQTPTLQLPLWNGPAPNAPEDPAPEVREPKGRVSNVSVPTLDLYLPEPGKSNGVAIIICSGGGYKRLASGPLGQGAAEIFLPQGYTILSLKYRLSPPSRDVVQDSLADAKRAVRIVRNNAQKWNIDPDRIGLVGFSAGANLILNLSTHYDPGNLDSSDPVDRQSCRPNFIGLCSAWPFGKKAGEYSINHDTPPAFIVHAKDDPVSPPAFPEALAAAWQAAEVPVYFEVYPAGGHEAFNFPNPAAADWTAKFISWLKERNFVK
jgi:endo-1,4-beta-xylanase